MKKSVMLVFAITVAATLASIPGDARAGRWCGPAGERVSRVIPDRFLLANFGNACRNHDICYALPNSNRAACDRRFRNSLLLACGRRYAARHRLLSACSSVAMSYYGFVRARGRTYHQRAQGRYNVRRGQATPVPRSRVNRPSTRRRVIRRVQATPHPRRRAERRSVRPRLIRRARTTRCRTIFQRARNGRIYRIRRCSRN